MTIRQALCWLPTFPDVPPTRTLESACTLAQLLGANLTVQLPQLDSEPSSWPAVMGCFPLDFPRMMRELVIKSEADASGAVQSLEKLAPQYGVKLDLRRMLSTPYASSAPLVDLARLHDLTILPVPESDAFGRACVQGVVFDSARPVVLLPSQHRRLQSLDRIVVAWDFSREAARALSDALPVLHRARDVRVVTVFGEKHIQTTAVQSDLEKFLEAHEIRHSLHQISFEGDKIGRFLTDYAMGVNADMLVMGAYGHSRLQEFVFGGATREMLRDPQLPVFLSH